MKEIKQCAICNYKFYDYEFSYAIRDIKYKESFLAWVGRHILKLITLGRHPRTFYWAYVCDDCVSDANKRMARSRFEDKYT